MHALTTVAGITCQRLKNVDYYFNVALPSELLRKRTEKFLRELNAHRG